MSPNKNFFFDFYKLDFALQKYIGFYLLDETIKFKPFFIIYIFSVNLIFSFLVDVVQILHLFTIGGDLEKLAECGYIIAIYCVGGVKSYLLFRNRKEFLDLEHQITDDDFAPKNAEQEELAKKDLEFMRKVKKVLMSFCFTAVFSSMIVPQFKEERALPLPAWYPFDTSVSPFYEMVYIHHAVGCFVLTCQNLYTELLFGGFSNFVGIQCDFLCDNLKNLTEDEVEVGFRDCIRHYKKILRFANTTEQVFSQIYFGQFLASTAALCMTLFLLTLVERATFEFFYLVFYQSSIFCLLLIPCWFSTEMKRKSENIPYAAYECPWINASHSFKKNLVYFIHRSQSPISLYAIGFFNISVETFMWIVRTSFSYYTVLNNLNMKNI